jgi:penicillin-binding protein 2A
MVKKLLFFIILIALLIGYYNISHTYVLKDNLNKQHYTTTNEVSPYFLKAIVATEDKRFYQNIGIDFRGISRALFKGAMDGKMTEGGSTITQQLVKNEFLTQERTAKRKIQEVFIALYIDGKYSKNTILEHYINSIYFGDGAYGIYNASMDYFGKKPSDLSIEESALLAGLPQAPSAYSPRANMKLALERRNIVLDIMVKENIISKEQGEKLKQKQIVLKSK